MVPQLRLIETTPALEHDGVSLAGMEETFRWRLFDEDELARWQPHGADRQFETDGTALILAGSSKYMNLSREVELEAAEIDVIHLALNRAQPGSQYWLQWARSGENFSLERSVHMPAGSLPWREGILIELRGRPEWQGPIERLRLGIGAPVGWTLQLRELVGYAHRVQAETEPVQSFLPRRVTLDDEMRNVVEARISRPIDWQVRIPKDSSLRFGYGVRAGDAREIEVMLLARGVDDRQETLFARTLQNGETETWHDVQIDLHEFSGQEVLLQFMMLSADLPRSHRSSNSSTPSWTRQSSAMTIIGRPRRTRVLSAIDGWGPTSRTILNPDSTSHRKRHSSHTISMTLPSPTPTSRSRVFSTGSRN